MDWLFLRNQNKKPQHPSSHNAMPLTFDGMHELISDFKKYSKETGEIKMFLCDKKGNPIEYKNTSRYAPLKLIIQYYKAIWNQKKYFL